MSLEAEDEGDMQGPHTMTIYFRLPLSYFPVTFP